MRQKSIGEILRTARKHQEWSLVDLQRRTKIPTDYLQALEYNDFEAIPNKEEREYFLQIYAQTLDLDSQILLEAYRKNMLVAYYEEDEELKTVELRRNQRVKRRSVNSYLPLIYLLVTAGIITIFISYMVHRYLENQPTRTQVESTYTVSMPSTIPQSSVESSSSSSAAPVQTPVTISGEGDWIEAVFTEVKAPIQVTLTAKDTTSWVSVSDTELAEGVTLSPENPTVTVTLPEGTPQTYIVLGVVEGIEVLVAGQAVDTRALTHNTGTISLIFQ